MSTVHLVEIVLEPFVFEGQVRVLAVGSCRLESMLSISIQSDVMLLAKFVNFEKEQDP
jgi:hypothetical protein